MRANRVKLIGGIAATAGVLLSLVSTTPASAEVYGSRIKNANSGWCLEVADWSLDNGAAVRQWGCTGGANQVWKISKVDAYYSQIINANSGKCLEAADWGTGNGTQVRQWACTGGANQLWRVPTSYSINDPAQEITNGNAWNKCLEIGGWSTEWGANANLWDCGGGQANQKWNYFTG
ncbi:RICIN domain-containing protein [Streptomyces sp. NPDC101160]|uniref:RICIN domain-containing protein n=1 Tax=Streptomyces sp. NPDC101160 TaxID=3366118 RepID=UPI0038190C05